jgi:hypothetical protein
MVLYVVIVASADRQDPPGKGRGTGSHGFPSSIMI